MPDVAYAKMKGKAGQNPKTIYKGERRRKVAELVAQGMSERNIARELGVGKTTVGRDKAWLKTSEHLLRAQETAIAVTELEDYDEMPTSATEFRELEIQNVIKLVAQKMTYEQVAVRLGISIATVLRHINVYLAEYGDFGGRTMMEWRNEHLLSSYALMSELAADMECQAIPGDVKGWDLTPFQAQRTRDAARKQYLALMQYQARLLQLLVQKTEVEVEQKVIVLPLRGVDLSMFPTQTSEPDIIDMTPEITWNT